MFFLYTGNFWACTFSLRVPRSKIQGNSRIGKKTDCCYFFLRISYNKSFVPRQTRLFQRVLFYLMQTIFQRCCWVYWVDLNEKRDKEGKFRQKLSYLMTFIVVSNDWEHIEVDMWRRLKFEVFQILCDRMRIDENVWMLRKRESDWTLTKCCSEAFKFCWLRK